MTHVPLSWVCCLIIAGDEVWSRGRRLSPLLQHPRRNPGFASCEKFQTWTAQLCHGTCRLRLPFEFFRRTVAERRMQSLLIVVSFDKFLDVSAQVIEVAVLVGVDLLPF